MSRILVINGSPSISSRTRALLKSIPSLLPEQHQWQHLDLRDLPAQELLSATVTNPAVAAAVEALASADGIVVGTPIYKAAYSGLLKVFLDLLPQFALAQKAVLPLATGGTNAHILALDYALRPVLCSLGARHIVASYFILDKAIEVNSRGEVQLEPTIASKYADALKAFSDSLGG